MAALLLGRAFPSLVPVGSSFSVLGNRLFISRFMTSSTTAAMEHTTLFRSITRVPPNIKGEDEDEKFQVKVDWKSPKIINGNRCFDMSATIVRGNWDVDLDIIAGSKTLLIKEVRISDFYKPNLHCFEQLVESEGITKGFIQSLLSLVKNKDGKTDCFERRPAKTSFTFHRDFE